MSAPAKRTRSKRSGASPAWDDRDLIEHCLQGDQRAWEALLAKYKKLIYSVPFRYHLSTEDAADIFQAVCLDLFTQLEQLRSVEALRSWLVRVAANKCFHWRQRENGFHSENLGQPNEGNSDLRVLPTWIDQLEQQQLVREAIGRLQPRCRDLIRMLFFEDDPRPYDEVARELRLATGSIGFIRGRCLQKLAQALEELGM